MANFYKKYNVKYMQPNFVFSNKLKEPKLKQEQYIFVAKLVNAIKAGREIVYMDETSVNMWNFRRRNWMSRSAPMKVTLCKDRGCGLTIFGAISNKRPELKYLIAKSTNKEDTVNFFEKLKREWEGFWNVIVVMDNHRAHHSNIVQDLLNKDGVDLMFLPPISSPLNPIEKVWSCLKHHWTRRLTELNGNIVES